MSATPSAASMAVYRRNAMYALCGAEWLEHCLGVSRGARATLTHNRLISHAAKPTASYMDSDSPRGFAKNSLREDGRGMPDQKHEDLEGPFRG